MSVYDNIVAGKYANRLPYNHEWRTEEQRLKALFRTDIEEEFEVTGHPKSERLWRLAWEYGHSSGFYDVYNYYLNLVDLIKD